MEIKNILLILFILISFTNAEDINLTKIKGSKLAKNIAKRVLFVNYFKQIKEENNYLLNNLKITGNTEYSNVKFPYLFQETTIDYIFPYLKGIEVNDYLPSKWKWDKEKGKLQYILTNKQVAFIKAIKFLESQGKYIGTKEPLNTNIIWYKPYGEWNIASYKYQDEKWQLLKILSPLIEENQIVLSDISQLKELPKIEGMQVYVENENGVLIPYVCKNNMWYPVGETSTSLKDVLNSFKELATNFFDLAGGSQLNVPSFGNDWNGYKTFEKIDSPEGGFWEDVTEKKYIVVKNFKEFKKIVSNYTFPKNKIFYFYDSKLKRIIKMIKNTSSNSSVYNPEYFTLELNKLSDLMLFNHDILPYSKYIIFSEDKNYFIKDFINLTLFGPNVIKYSLYYGNTFATSTLYGYVIKGNRNNIISLENDKIYFFSVNDCNNITCNGTNSIFNYYKGDIVENTYYIFKKNKNPDICKDLNQLTDCYN